MEALAKSSAGRRARGLLMAAVGLALIASLCLAPHAAYPQASYLEDAVKAAYLYRFTQYVEWPNHPQRLDIAVMDAPEVAQELAKILAAHPQQAPTLQVRNIRSGSDMNDAAVLYVGSEPSDRLRGIIAGVASRPLLIVTDDPEGLSLGGTINFLRIDRHLRFEVSLVAAERSKLHVSSGLLDVAARVERSTAR